MGGEKVWLSRCAAYAPGGAAAPDGGGLHRPGACGEEIRPGMKVVLKPQLGDEQAGGGHRHHPAPGGRCGQVCPESRGEVLIAQSPETLYPCGHEGPSSVAAATRTLARVGLFPCMECRAGGHTRPRDRPLPLAPVAESTGAITSYRPVQAEDPGWWAFPGERILIVRRGARALQPELHCRFPREAGFSGDAGGPVRLSCAGPVIMDGILGHRGQRPPGGRNHGRWGVLGGPAKAPVPALDVCGTSLIGQAREASYAAGGPEGPGAPLPRSAGW